MQNLSIINRFYDKIQPLLKHEDKQVKLNAATVVRILVQNLASARDTLRTPIFGMLPIASLARRSLCSPDGPNNR